jgi:hypothetical protein
MKKLLISASLLWAVALTTVAQDNFKLTGKIDGATLSAPNRGYSIWSIQ